MIQLADSSLCRCSASSASERSKHQSHSTWCCSHVGCTHYTRKLSDRSASMLLMVAAATALQSQTIQDYKQPQGQAVPKECTQKGTFGPPCVPLWGINTYHANQQQQKDMHRMSQPACDATTQCYMCKMASGAIRWVFTCSHAINTTAAPAKLQQSTPL